MPPTPPDDIHAMLLSARVSTSGSVGIGRPRRADHLRRDQQILDAVVGLAARGGYASVHMRSVAAHANVSLSTLYEHFPSKVHLLSAALVEELDAFHEVVRGALHGVDDPLLGLHYTADCLVEAMGRSGGLTEAMTHAYAAAHAVAPVCADHVRTCTRTIFTAMTGAKDHIDSRAEVVADLLTDVWTAEVLALVQRRQSLSGMQRRIHTAIDLLHRRGSK